MIKGNNQTNVTTTVWVGAVTTLLWAGVSLFKPEITPSPEVVTALNLVLLGLIQYFKPAA